MTYEDYLREIKADTISFLHVPVEHMTHELCLETVKNGRDFRHIPKEHRTYELCLEAAKNEIGLAYIIRGNFLRDVPEEYRTYELCLEYMKHGRSLEYIPEDIQEEMIRRLEAK